MTILISEHIQPDYGNDCDDIPIAKNSLVSMHRFFNTLTYFLKIIKYINLLCIKIQITTVKFEF